MLVSLSREKNDAANRAHRPSFRGQFTFTPLASGSPYCPVTLGFLQLARRGPFNEPAHVVWESKNYKYQPGAADWPLFSQVDNSTQTLTNRQLNCDQLRTAFKSSILSAGYNAVDISRRSYRSGFATRFVLARAIENGGRFESQDVEQLNRLGGWTDKSPVVLLYIKRIIEEYSDTAGLLNEEKFQQPNQPSKVYPELGPALFKYITKEVGDAPILRKQPISRMF